MNHPVLSPSPTPKLNHSPQSSKNARPLRRFAVEALCLFMLLYGAPLQALEAALPRVEVDVPEFSLEIDETLNRLSQGFGMASQMTEDAAAVIIQQPWADALVWMLTASSFGATQELSAPPSPPSDDRSVEDYDLAGLAKGFGNKDALDAIPLLPGWNQISLPEVPGTSDSDTVLSAIGGSYTKIYAYDGCDPADPWKVYDPADPTGSDLTSIGVEQGLLVDATAAVELPSDGTLPDSTTFQFCTGWNLIGFPSAQPRHVRSALAPILDKVVRVFAFDPFDINDPWAFFEKDAPVWASDLDTMEPGRGYWILVTEDVQFEIKNVGDAPDIAFASPLDLDVVTAPTEIHGRVSSDLLESWQLRYRGVGESTWIGLAEGSYPVDGKLGDFDPTLLLNGMYELELTATDLQGLQVTDSIVVVALGNMKIGHFTLSFVDLAIPLSGLDIEVVRTYDSRQRHLQGDFGYGWNLDIRQGSYRNNRPPGDGWQIRATEGPWGLPCSPDAVLETKSHLTTIRLSDQEIYRFRLVIEDPGTIIGGCIGRADFEFVDGPIPGATLEILGNTSVLYQNNTDELRDPNTFQLYVPEDVQLTTRDGRIFHLDLEDGVTHLEDLNGNTLDITPQGITHSSGRNVEFERDAEERITRIIDPMGNANVYAYDADGNHVTFIDRMRAETQFVYTGEHYLEDIVNALGVRAVRTEYDEDGRIARIIDAAGQAVALDHDLTGRREVITNRLGFVRVLEYNSRGNVVREVDEAGGVTLRTFDASDNLLSETDPLGRVTTSEYTLAGDRSKWVRPLGRTVEISFNDLGLPTAVRDPLNQESQHRYDSAGNLLQTTNVLGTTSALRYGSSGNPREMQDASGNVHQFVTDAAGQLLAWTPPTGSAVHTTYNANGQPLQETRQRTVAGQVETVTTTRQYDALGRLLAMTHPDGAMERFEYDPLGRVTTFIDAGGHRTQYQYDARDRLSKTVFPDASEQLMTYDDEGRLTSQTVPGGHTWTFGYDALGRRTSVEAPDSGRQTFSYDAAGQLILAQDELGNETQFLYDAAGRRTGRIDALDHTTLWAYDALDRLISETDPNGHTTTYAYDGAGRLTQTSFADGSAETVRYDPLGKPAQHTNAQGIETHFTRDALGRLTEVDIAGNTTQYRWDALGNLVETLDALGRSTQLEYDFRGRLTKRTLPDDAFEAWTYNSAGGVATHRRLGGGMRTYVYDVRQRVSEWTDSEGDWARLSYDSAGRLRSAENTAGAVHFDFDSVGRMVRKTHPGGHQLDYAYDLAGRQTQLQATLGQTTVTTSSSYDAMGRPTSLVDSRTGQYRFTYDAAGNRTLIEYPNGVTSQRSYDATHRLSSMLNQDANNNVILGLDYVREPGGRVQQLNREGDGIRRYQYEASGALAQEEVLDPSESLLERTTYAYDAAGNRISASIEVPSVPTVDISYQYDARDRLLSADTQAWSWDQDGRLTERGGISYSWSSEQQITEAVTADGAHTLLAYDALGESLSTILEQGGVSDQTDPLVDSRGALSHVVAESSPNGVTSWTRVGDELLAVHDADGSRYYHGDGIGTVLALTDDSGAVSDTYSFDAFGVLEEHVGDSSQPYAFAGEPFSEHLGLAHHRARWMDPEVGRFVSPDPFPGVLEIPSTQNVYPYVLGDPVNAVDPTGRYPDWLVQILLGGEVHRAIGRHFRRNSFPPGRRVSDLDINTILGDGSLCYREGQKAEACRSRPDLTHLDTFEVYEIKTRKGRDRGRAQLERYLGILKTFDRYGYRNWHGGSSYAPPSTLDINAFLGFWQVYIDDPQFGVITYSVERRLQFEPVTVPLVILTVAILNSINVAITSKGVFA